jgi:hypothetical protein
VHRFRGFIVVAAAFLAYLPVFANDFAWDDEYLVLRNPAITDLSRVPGLFAEPWAGDVDYALGQAQNRPYFRPMALASMAVDWAVGGGPNPVVFHGTNLLIHAIASLLLFMWLGRLFMLADTGRGMPPAGAPSRSWTPLVLAVLWAVHPVSSEAVCLVSYRTTLLSGLAVFGGMWLLTPRFAAGAQFQGAARLLQPGVGSVLGGVGFMVFGLLAKEPTLVLPGLLLMQDVFLRGLKGERFVFVYLPLVVVGIAYLWVRSQVTGEGVYTYFDGLDTFQAALMLPRIFFLYVRLVVLPTPLCPFYDWGILGVPYSLLEPDIIAGSALLIAMVMGTLLLARRLPLVAFGLAFFGLALLPVSHIVPFFDAAGERFLYVPLAGPLIAVGATSRFLSGSSALRTIWKVLAVTALVGFTALTLVRARDWRDSETILRVTTRDFPSSISAHLGLARLLLAKDRPGEAIEPLAHTVQAHPDLAVGHGLLAVAQARSGDYEGARRTLLEAPPPQPRLPSASQIARGELLKTGHAIIVERLGL